ncbi:MAG: 30S ribosomal protein S16, partial [bacterium]|nr:30S ribosomal protein S16 [bacterium]
FNIINHMLVIRLLRTGKKNQPSFKIVVTRKTNPPKGGRFLEEVGTYNPLTKNKTLKADRVKYWMSVGAKPSDTVFNMLVAQKVVEGKKLPKHKKEVKKEAAVEPQA